MSAEAAIRQEKATLVLSAARAMAASAEGLTLYEIAGAGRRTAERLRNVVRELFLALEERADDPRKRFGTSAVAHQARKLAAARA